MVQSTCLGFPRIGAKRELKKALESFWKGEIDERQLLEEGSKIKAHNWKLQAESGIDLIPSNDFSYYDQMLDTACMVGAIPERFAFSGNKIDVKTYFAMARGNEKATAMEMTKWFDTNYHYIVPELRDGQKFSYLSTKAVDDFKEAQKLGVITKPVLIGPITFLMLSKMPSGGSTLSLLDALLPVYQKVLEELEAAGAEYVQIDEPCLVLDLNEAAKKAYKTAYATLMKGRKAKIFLATYFDSIAENLPLAIELGADILHIDLARKPEQLDSTLKALPKNMSLSLGLVDGRNIWKSNLEKLSITAKKVADSIGHERVIISSSCSLMHSPVDLNNETKLDSELKSWLAFATQKLLEINAIKQVVSGNESKVASILADSKKSNESRASSSRIHNPAVKDRYSKISSDMLSRKSPFPKRIGLQQAKLKLPMLPTTTIGSFPQTAEVRAARAEFKASKIDAKAYDAFIAKETENCIKAQEEMGIDVLVHGEFERNDMVEYFGEQLSGFLFTQNGWVQSYGSRYVKPPVIFGDVSRPSPMTVFWSEFAQSKTSLPVKGMLTGPVTILQWSFVRDDQPREATCKQIALAIRDEVADLEKAGINVIQIDEPAIREGLPLRKADWKSYLRWAVDSFRLSAAVVRDETQIHTHMCYSEFNDIIAEVAEMDADVISIETSRSHMELLDAFVDFKYPNQIGPGVYDIHSPRVPDQKEMEDLLEKALKVLAPEQIWVNPDCGLKTRGWKETRAALEKMVAATKKLRTTLSAKGNVA